MKPRLIFTVINDLTYDPRMHRICTSLANNGYDVLLVGRKLKQSVPLSQEKFSQKRLHLLFTKGKLFYIEYNIRLFFFLLIRRFDIACGIDLDTILPCYFVSKLKGRKCVYDAHEIFSEVPEVVRRPTVQRWWKRVERFAVNRIQNCYTVSESVAEYFHEQYQRKFEVIRNVPVKSDLPPSSGKTNSDFIILYQGALNEGRGLEAMIGAMKFLPAKLILAGDGDLSQLLKRKVNELHLDDKVTFTGKKSPQELKELTAQSDVGLNLLENKGLNYYYSLANKFFDYVHAGVPQLTMSFPEYEKMNKESEVAVLINDLQSETIVNNLKKLMEEKDFYFRLRSNCLNAREAWNWQREEAKLIAFYQQLR